MTHGKTSARHLKASLLRHLCRRIWILVNSEQTLEHRLRIFKHTTVDKISRPCASYPIQKDLPYDAHRGHQWKVGLGFWGFRLLTDYEVVTVESTFNRLKMNVSEEELSDILKTKELDLNH